MIIGIDFDGTCVEGRFPDVGFEVKDSVRVMKRLAEEGHKLILLTMRSDRLYGKSVQDTNIKDEIGPFLSEAVMWFYRRGIPLYGVNENPQQVGWSTSRKVYCDYYIDDRAIGCPMEGEVVDWGAVEILLEEKEVLKDTYMYVSPSKSKVGRKVKKIYDVNCEEVRPGDRLRHQEWGYDVIVKVDNDYGLYGEEVENKHPYALNKGKGYVKVNT